MEPLYKVAVEEYKTINGEIFHEFITGASSGGGGGGGGGGAKDDLKTLTKKKALITRGAFTETTSTSENEQLTSFASGVVHIYRDLESKVRRQSAFSDRLNDVVAFLAVPSYMTASDFLGFVGEGARSDVSHFRMIRTKAPNRYMVLLKFYDAAKVKKFLEIFNGKSFNSMDAETCHVVRVTSVTFEAHNAALSSFPFIDTVADGDEEQEDVRNQQPEAASPSESSAASLSVLLKPAAPRTRSLRELPTCPVCLERMDANITGLLTILCQHTFHCACLSKWGDGSCPVCRYSQNQNTLPLDRTQQTCRECGAVDNLWICMICGNIGCGRYDEAHAYKHFAESGHLYSMDIETSRVWDYAGDEYVHRLIQNKADGKLVELPSSPSSGG